MTQKLNILLLCDYIPGTANTIIDHIEAFKRHSKHSILTLNNRPTLPENFNIDNFDVIVLHYSLIISHNNYLCTVSREKIRLFKGLKIVFIQDDYRWVNRTCLTLDYLGIDVLFGLAAPLYARQMYQPHFFEKPLRYEMVLAGYVPENLLHLKTKPYEDRKIDVCYRARKLPAWLGYHGQEKWIIADKFLKGAPRYNLKCDISWQESDRIYGKDWIDFLSNSKAALGTECGASLCDFDNTIEEKIENHLKSNPDASFKELSDLFFKNLDGKIYVSGISPRIFEQAALKTLMILYEGDYSGILKAGRHYMKLERDHSNMEDVVAFLRNPEKVKEMTECAYREIAANPSYTYKAMIEKFDDVIHEMIKPNHIAISRNIQMNFDYFIKGNKTPEGKAQKKVYFLLRIYNLTFRKILKYCPLSIKLFMLSTLKKILKPFNLFEPPSPQMWIEETDQFKEFLKARKLAIKEQEKKTA